MHVHVEGTVDRLVVRVIWPAAGRTSGMVESAPDHQKLRHKQKEVLETLVVMAGEI